MQFLADESCDFNLVRVLREAGYDVTAICETSPRAEDNEVIEQAVRESRVLLTEDKDFGQLVFAHGREARGVVFVRYPPAGREKLFTAVCRLIKQHGRKLAGCCVVVEPGRVRIGRIPRP
jgi:predicted nuclease of predicted toxin-antitoxin system